MKRRRIPSARTFLTLACLLSGWLGTAAATAQPAFLVKDLNTTKARTLGETDLAPIVAVGTNVFFAGDDGSTGMELRKLDTTTGVTSLVKDLCPGACSSLPWALVAAGGQLFFRGDDGTHGFELWKSDGTTAGTTMVADINPGVANSFYAWVGALGTTLFFSAGDPSHGFELWALDTVTLKTRRVADIDPGPNSSDPQFIAAAGGRLLFAAYESDSYGAQLWISDGTTTGTHRVRNPGTFGPWFYGQNVLSPQPGIGLPDGSFLFAANDGGSQGLELWRTDGTDAGTALVADLNSGGDSAPSGFISFGGRIFFGAISDAGSGLWVTDGTSAGTSLVKATGAIDPFSIPSLFTIAGGKLYFVGGSGEGPLWVTDGTSAGTIPLGPSDAHAIAAVGSTVYALDGDLFSSSLQLLKTDGTVAGTTQVKTIGLQSRLCLFGLPLSAAGGKVFFFDCNPDVGQQLWKSDGTAAGTVVAHAPSRTPSFPFPDPSDREPFTFLKPLGSELVFSADDDEAVTRIWKTDGTPHGTWAPLSYQPRIDIWPQLLTTPPLLLKDRLLYAPDGELQAIHGGATVPESLLPSGVDGSSLYRLGDLALFSRTSGNVTELWKTDGSPAGTARVGAQTGVPLATLGSQLFLLANAGQIWKTDGTSTVLVKDLALGANASVHGWTTARGLLFFVLRDETAGTETLWRSDGSDAGTLPLLGFPWPASDGAFYSSLNGPYAAGDRVLFGEADAAHGREIWVSDGTVAGTHLVQDSRPGPLSSHGDLYRSVVVRGRLFYPADDGVHGQELWVSDGTDAGTHLVKDINPGAASSQGSFLTAMAVRDRLFFLADDGVHGYELWVTDGTDAGTHLVKDILPGAAGALISQLAPLGNLLLFSASDGTHGGEPWISDGTTAGTHMIQDIAPGAASSGPVKFTSASSLVYFLADDGTTGSELWALPRAALPTSFTDVATGFWAWGAIEALADAGITTGCAPNLYCPGNLVSRAEMAAFLERGAQGPVFTPPPPTGTRFTDVPADYWAAGWIEQLAADGITTGCAPNLYCPASPVDRSEMAVFLLRVRHGGAYVPPHVAASRFADVPPGYWAQDWIEELAAEGITTGCAPSSFCPGDSVGRDQMAVFLARTFRLPLP